MLNVVFGAIRSKLAGGIDPFLLSCWACLSHDLLSVCKRYTKLTVADLLKIIATDSDTLAQTAQEHAASNINAEIPVNLCPANLLYKVLCTKHPDMLVGGPLKRPAASAGSAAIANANKVERNDAEDAVEVAVDGAPDVGSVDSGGSAPSRRRRWALNVLAAAEAPAPSQQGVAKAKAGAKTVPLKKPRQRISKKTASSSSRTPAKAKAKAAPSNPSRKGRR